uniref:Uncharacterized protein n=1 Tax=viral metagenome TaxID=1070528 RepID=A0A6C0HIA3_9ZZZZ
MVRYRIYNDETNRFIDAIGNYVYVSVHSRGTSVNLQPAGGILLGFEEYDSIDENYTFHYEDIPAFRSDMTSIRGSSINACIQQLSDENKTLSYQQLVDMVIDNNASDDYYQWNREADFFKYHKQITLANKIYYEKSDDLCFIITRFDKIVEELREINAFCNENDISFQKIT